MLVAGIVTPLVRRTVPFYRCEWTVPRPVFGFVDTDTQCPIEPLVYRAEGGCYVLHYPSRRAFVRMFPDGVRAAVLHADISAAGDDSPGDILRVWFDRRGFTRGLFVSNYATRNYARVTCRLGQVTDVGYLDPSHPFMSAYCTLTPLAHAPSLRSIFARLPCDFTAASAFAFEENSGSQ